MLLDPNAVNLPEALRIQLEVAGLDPDLKLFLEQKALKAQAREEKAARVVAKGKGALA